MILVRAAVTRGQKVVVLDALTYAGHLTNLEGITGRGSCMLIEGNIANRELVPELLRDNEIEAVAKIIRSGKMFRYGDDSQCDLFERRYSEFLGVRHANMTSSGTSALTAAVSAMGIGPGDEVLVPAHTYMATANAVIYCGATPVFGSSSSTSSWASRCTAYASWCCLGRRSHG